MRALPSLRIFPTLLLAAAAATAEPLDVQDPMPRTVLVQVETSANLATVGQSFGPVLPATYSASGGTGTLVIPIESHEGLRTNGFEAVPGTFTPYVVHIDLATLAATSEPTSGAIELGEFRINFNQHALGTGTLAGFIGPSVGPLICTSQADADLLCTLFGICGQSCTIVPGSAYDPLSGKVNLVGAETDTGCDGWPLCEPQTFTFFSQYGDLRLSEAVVPALPWPAAAALALLLLATTAFVLRGRRSARVALLLAAALLPAAARAYAPLDLSDPTPRDAMFQLEGSGDLATVGQNFGPPLPATYSASGGVGTFVIPVASHEALRGGTPVPGSFTPIVIEIDLATHAATSQPAQGQTADGPISFSYSLHALTTSGTAGFVGPNFNPPLLCTSQQQINDWCPIFPPICGKSCIQVAGVAFDPATGKVNLVGADSQTGCDGTVCTGPLTLFTGIGDLRLLEVDEVPALPWPAPALVAVAIAAVAGAARMRRHADALRRQRPRL